MPSAPELLGQRLIAEVRLARYEAAVKRSLLEALRNQERRSLALLRSVQAAVLPIDPFDEASWTDELERTVRPAVEGVFAEITTDAERFFVGPGLLPEIDLTHRLDRLLGAMRGLSPELSKRLGDTLTEGVNRGESIDKLSGRVRDTFGVGESRARLIARTETVGAANGASDDAAGALARGGIALEKTWLATLDSRVRPTHRDANGQTVPYDQPFKVGTHELMFPGDPGGPVSEIANCRCTATYDEAKAEPAVPTNAARNSAYKAVTPYRRELKAEARKVSDDAMAQLERADVPRLSRPPKRTLHIDPVSGKRSHRRGTGGEWDWFDQLAPEEQARLRRWMVDNDVDMPDQIAQRWTANFGGEGDVDDVMQRWVEMTRLVDGGKAINAGRLPARGAYGDLNFDDLAPDFAQRFHVEAIYDELEDAARYVAEVRAGEAVELAERAFVHAEAGPAPWTLTEEQWVTEVYANLDRVDAGRVVGRDEWGDTFNADGEAALRRLAELVPKGWDPFDPEIDTAYPAIVELAVRAGLTRGP